MLFCLFTAYFAIGTVYENFCADIQKYKLGGVKKPDMQKNPIIEINRIGVTSKRDPASIVQAQFKV